MRTIGSLIVIGIATAVVRTAAPPGDLPPFEQFGVRLNANQLDALRRGRVVVEMMEAHGPSELALFACARIDVRPAQFFEALQHSAILWRGAKVPRTGTFSTPVGIGDIEAMQLPAGDVEALRHCRPGDCDVKLGASEIARLDAAIDASPNHWRSAAQAAFRAMVLDRIRAYRRHGLAGLPVIRDHREAIAPAVAFGQIASSPELSGGAAAPLIGYLSEYPRASLNSRAELLYWLEVTDSPKPTIQAAHLVIDRTLDGGAIEVVAASRQIFATHYINGSLAVTILARTPAGDRFMLYINRSSVDGLDGFLSGLKRLFIRGRVRRAGLAAFEHLKRRIERYADAPAGDSAR
jgi:hypothetical protein